MDLELFPHLVFTVEWFQEYNSFVPFLIKWSEAELCCGADGLGGGLLGGGVRLKVEPLTLHLVYG